RRHPHVFGETRARTPEEALKSWNAVKATERAAGGQADSENDAKKSLLDGITPALPSTLEAYELGVRAAEAGFDWAKVDDLLDKVDEEVRELRRELSREPSGESGGRTPPASARVEEEVGDLLFAAANLARFLDSDPESCLRRANQKFKRRFQALEQEVAKRGAQVRECSPEGLDRIWNDVKARE